MLRKSSVALRMYPFSAKNTAPSALCVGCSKFFHQPVAYPFANTASRPATAARRATPSTRAAARIMLERMSLEASG